MFFNNIFLIKLIEVNGNFISAVKKTHLIMNLKQKMFIIIININGSKPF